MEVGRDHLVTNDNLPCPTESISTPALRNDAAQVLKETMQSRGGTKRKNLLTGGLPKKKNENRFGR